MLRIHYIKHPWHGPDFWTGMLFIEGPETHFLVDTAVKEAVDTTIAAFLKERNIPWDSISKIINTHSHSDHVEGNPRLRELTGAEFSIHRNGAEGFRAISGFSPDRELEDGCVLEQDGISVRIIHTPGHSADSVCIFEPETGTLFTGDAVQAQGSPNIGLALYADPEAYCDSMRKLRRLCETDNVQRLILGHPERPCRGELSGKREITAFLELSERTAEEYCRVTDDFLRENPEGGHELLRDRLLRLCGGISAPAWPELSYNTAAAHLKYARR